MSHIPNPKLPSVRVVRALHHGQVLAITFDFVNAPHLREQVLSQLKRLCEQEPRWYGQITITVPADSTIAYAALERPTRNIPMLDSLLHALAKENEFELPLIESMSARTMVRRGFRDVATPSWLTDHHPN